MSCKYIKKIGYALIVTAHVFLGVFWVSCAPFKHEKLKYPDEIQKRQDIIGKIEEINPVAFNVIDTSSSRLYALGNYFILKSMLCGPSGIASHYTHYMLMTKDFSHYDYFASLSSEIHNVWMSQDTLYVNLLDFIYSKYERGVYGICDSCDFEIIHMRLATSSFTLDTLEEEQVKLTWKDLKSYLISDIEVAPQ